MKKLIVIALVLVGFSFSAQAEVSPELLKAVPNIYSGYFGSAKKTINAHIQAHPDDPYGYILRGMSNEWYQLLRNKGKSLNATIMADYQKARRLAEAALEKDKNSIDAKVALGNALMYISKKQIDSGHKMNAGSSLKKSKNIMMEVIKKDPNQTQAYFAAGVFNYFSANVPSGFKWLATLLGFKGNTATGLSYLKKAASQPTLSQGDAKFMLMYLYSQKLGQYKTALQYAQSLHAQYPNNHIFLFDAAEMQHRTGDKVNARQNFEKFLEYCEKNKGRCSQRYRFLANYFMTWSYMDDKDYANAKKYAGPANELNTKRYKDRTRDLGKWMSILKSK